MSVASGNTVYRSEGNCIIEIATDTLIIGTNNSIIPDTVKIIRGKASGIASIDAGAFSNCKDLTEITIPAGVTSIEGFAFRSCYKLSSITVLAVTPPQLGFNAFDDIAEDAKIYVPAGCAEAYKTAVGWSVYAAQITDV